jgi:protein O-GlcNAc transferase
MTPAQIRSLHLTAAAHLQAGRLMEAEAALRQLVQMAPTYAPAFFLLGGVGHKAGRIVQAMEYLKKAISLDPGSAEPYFALGLIFHQQRQFPQAIEAYRQCLTRSPGHPNVLNNLGRALLDAKQVAEAKRVLEQAVIANPKNAGALCNLGDAFRLSGDLGSAETHYRKAVTVDPNCGQAHCNLGILQASNKQSAQSIASFGRAIAINPKSFNARFNLSRILQDVGQFDEAVQQCRTAIELQPNSSQAHNVLGNLMGIMGEVPLCIASQQCAVQLQPDHAANHSNLLLSLQYRDDMPITDRLAAHREWERQHISKLTPLPPIQINHNQKRQLRIGYVSPNFQQHSVAYFIEPVLAARDRSALEIFCYSNTKASDETTGRFKALADHWRDIELLPDLEVAGMIRRDGVDILVDLAGHTAGNRLPVFGYRPAPIQMTWIGYPATTGMTAIDYRLTDAVADPADATEPLHTEKLIRIPGGCWAYAGSDDAPAPAPPPSIATGFITFGSFNNLPKVTPQVLQTWAEILKRVPKSQLLLKASGLRGQLARDYVIRHLKQTGVDPDRVELLSWAPTTKSHLEIYNRVDIALDTFPYNGTTTTCEALWMGVPVVTFPGNRHVARVGASLLTHARCKDWVANDVKTYIGLAAALAGNIEHLKAQRLQLRDRLKASPLCDAGRLASELEQIYRAAVALAPASSDIPTGNRPGHFE